MATKTASVSGLWSDTATWGGAAVPINGDGFNIPAGIVVKCDVDQSGMANGMAASVIDGLLHFDADTNTCLKMNGNLTGTGALYICERATVTGFTLTTDKTNTYQVSRSLDVATVEDTLGAGYLDAVEELVETAIDVENAARVAQGLNEMMPDAVQTFIETTRAGLTLSQILAYVEATPASFYHDSVNDLLYIHTSDSTDPSGKTITVIEPINRPAAGSEYRNYILFNSTGTIAMTGTPIIRAYGWYPEREWTQLAADAAAGQNQIVLKHDYEIQQGDKLIIGSGTENIGAIAETAKGLYTVSAYDSGTKTVTLTANLGTNRLLGDYVALASAPIKKARTSGVNAIITSVINNVHFIGCCFSTKIESTSTTQGYPTGWMFKHSKFPSYIPGGLNEVIFSDCCFYGATNYMAGLSLYNSLFKRCTSIIVGYDGIISDGNVIVDSCIFQNHWDIISLSRNVLIKNSFLKQFSQLVGSMSELILNNCELYGVNRDAYYAGILNATDCTFKDNTIGYLRNVGGKLKNCIFEGAVDISGYNSWYNKVNDALESFDHNQLPGNYKAWMRGGKIETALDGSTILPGRLILTCESADYPVFRDFPVLLPAYRTSTWQALTKKSFTGGSVKIELIDPASDPLIDPSAQPLASYSLPDTKDTNLPLKLGYKSTVPMQAIIRISAQNSNGTVEVDTRLIENRVQHGQ